MTAAMAVLEHVSTGKIVFLGPHAVAGRAPGSAVRLADLASSSDHASLTWTGERWEARDLGSTNGTSADGRTLEPRENAPLTRGTELRFGADGERWVLIDDGPPAAVARSIATGEIRIAKDGLLALPDPERVLVSVLLDASGCWLVETEGGARRAARDAERLTIDGQAWELGVPAASPVGGTHKAKGGPRLSSLTLRFIVSPEDKHVRVEAVGGRDVLPLPERASFAMLLVLARERLKDAAAGVSEDEQGWLHVIDVAESLRKEEGAVNVDIHRAREVLAKAGIEGAEGIVQRRPREIRIGTGRLSEVKT